MKIRFDEATAAELRQFLKERFDVTAHHLSKAPSLLKKARDLGATGDDFEIQGSPPDDGPTDAELEREAGSFDADKLVAALVAQGMPEDEAKDVAGLTVNAQIQKQLRETDELPYGPGKEHLYVTVRIRPERGKFGNEAVPLSVNGNTIWVPRGVDHPIRTPYLECLMHAERIEYEQILRPDEHGTPHVEHRPRKSLTHPVELLTPIPYDRAEAEKVAEKAKGQIAAIAA